jgi:hypothetical protein
MLLTPIANLVQDAILIERRDSRPTAYTPRRFKLARARENESQEWHPNRNLPGGDGRSFHARYDRQMAK